MRFTPQLLDEIRARLPVSQVVARKVQLKKAGREWRGLSPFKTERTPSFFVNDQKGFYHCFASGSHGDIFKFVMETEGLSFMEAVERLAGEAGLPLPAAEPRSAAQREKVDQLSRLTALLEAATAFFEASLAGPGGDEARRYIARRGLKSETIAAFRIGYAPAGRSSLREALAGRGFSVEEMARSGMLISGPDIPVAYDRFRHRVMFPITDAKGRTIAFGGRALDKDAPAKYLNSPETPLFHKGAVLFNAARARPLAFERSRIIAVEGYMDVIALAEAGFGETVAPLGTALTEAQVQLLWRMAPEPILCFDGDAAGKKAAYRAVDTVLPHLKPGLTVRFAFLPDGLDPDDLVRARGREAFEAVLASHVRPLFDVLMEKEELADSGSLTPDQRAALEVRLKSLVGRIGDPVVRGQYETELRQTLWERSRREVRALTGAGGRRSASAIGRRRDNTKLDWRIRDRAVLEGPRSRTSRPPPPAVASNELVARAQQTAPREALLMRTLINHPWLIEEHAEAISTLTFAEAGLARLRDALLSATMDENLLDRETLASHLTAQGFAPVLALVQRAITHKGDKFAEPEADRAAVETGWHHAVALHRKTELRRELAIAEQAWHEEGSDDAYARICEIQAELMRTDGTEPGFEGVAS
ncbi:MAG: DNA primase [Hyphomicrobiaceae bacterium]|nr:DNA primase [Hyphomicrobiaceae bacterium]